MSVATTIEKQVRGQGGQLEAPCPADRRAERLERLRAEHEWLTRCWAAEAQVRAYLRDHPTPEPPEPEPEPLPAELQPFAQPTDVGTLGYRRHLAEVRRAACLRRQDGEARMTLRPDRVPGRTFGNVPSRISTGAGRRQTAGVVTSQGVIDDPGTADGECRFPQQRCALPLPGLPIGEHAGGPYRSARGRRADSLSTLFGVRLSVERG